RDLFGTDHVISDIKLAKAMAAERIDAECAKLVADGWAWALPKDGVKSEWTYGRLKVDLRPTPDEQQRLDRLNRIAHDWRRDDDEETDRARDELKRLETELQLRALTRPKGQSLAALSRSTTKASSRSNTGAPNHARRTRLADRPSGALPRRSRS